LFAQMLSGVEITLGGALLLSFVLCRILGAALAGFSAGLILVPHHVEAAAGRQAQTDPGRERCQEASSWRYTR
jgi:hypothetical protein